MMFIYFVWLQRINSLTTFSVLTTISFFIISKHPLKNTFIKKNYLKQKVINFLQIINIIILKK